MQLSIVFTSLLATGALAFPSVARSFQNPFSPIPNYPLGNGFCLTDSQANFIAAQFQSILTNPNRQGANVTAQTLVTTNYVETSDSINTLAGYPLGGSTFVGRTGFINGVVTAPAIPSMQTLAVFHDCTNILWRWLVTGLGSGEYEIKGMNHFIASPLTGQISTDYLEFNSIAWGRDIGWTCTPPGQ